MVQVALLTGCRYSELANLRVSDYNPDAGTIQVRITKTGKPRHVILTEDGQRYVEGVTAGRDPEDLMLKKANGKPWARSHQARPLREACKRAKIKPSANFHALRHTYASHALMGGVPLQVIAENLGHSDTRMVEKHYGHLAPSYRAERIRAGTPTLGVVEQTKVASLHTKSR
jgi:integrase